MKNIAINVLCATALGVAAGCSADRSSEQQPEAMLSGTWQVEDIDQRGIVDRSMTTVQFAAPDQVAGSTGCNRYTGAVNPTDGRFIVTNVAATRKACIAALANQEQRFLNALSAAARYTVEPEGWLVIFDADGQRRLRLVRMAEDRVAIDQPASQVMDQVMDEAMDEAMHFDCGDAGPVSARFVGPETLEITAAGDTVAVQRQPSQSGARYAGGGTTFWNQGAQAVLGLGGEDQACTRINP